MLCDIKHCTWRVPPKSIMYIFFYNLTNNLLEIRILKCIHNESDHTHNTYTLIAVYALSCINNNFIF